MILSIGSLNVIRSIFICACIVIDTDVDKPHGCIGSSNVIALKQENFNRKPHGSKLILHTSRRNFKGLKLCFDVRQKTAQDFCSILYSRIKQLHQIFKLKASTVGCIGSAFAWRSTFAWASKADLSFSTFNFDASKLCKSNIFNA